MAEKNLQPHPNWLNKCIQLYETSLVRHGIMLVGPAGAGKTSMMDCLAAALSEMGQKTVIWRMNPKVGPAYLACGLQTDIILARIHSCQMSSVFIRTVW